MNKFGKFLNVAFKQITAAIFFALLCMNFVTNAIAANRVEQQKTLSEAATRLLADQVKDFQDSAMRATTVGFLMELSAKLDHLRDLEELTSIAGPDMQDVLRAKMDSLRRYYFGYGCTIIVNNIETFVSVAHEAQSAASLKNAKHVVADICGNAKKT